MNQKFVSNEKITVRICNTIRLINCMDIRLCCDQKIKVNLVIFLQDHSNRCCFTKLN